MRGKFSDDDIIKMYNYIKDNNTSITNYCKENHVDKSNLCERFKKLNLPTLNANNAKSFNEKAFDVINDESAYWLGILLADGSVHIKNDSKKSHYLELCMKDKEHIEKFRNFLSSSHKISKRTVKSNGSIVYRIIIGSKYMCTRLIELGIKPNKTYEKINFNNFVDKQFLPSFIRGFFDGDGSIDLNPSNHIRYIGFTSMYEESLKSLQTVIKENCNVYFDYLDVRESKAPMLRLYKQTETIKFLDWIYASPQCVLDRKYNKYKNCCRPD